MEANQTTEQRVGRPRDSKTESLWQRGIEEPAALSQLEFRPDAVYDTLIVGGGITPYYGSSFTKIRTENT